MTEAELEALGGRGWFTRDGFPFAAEAARVAAARSYVPARVSRGHVRDETVRTDALCWLDAGDAELAPLVAAFEALRLELNTGAWLGLTRFDLQLAKYEAGGRYVRHSDALNGRRVTAIVYLNPAWTPAHGGQLRLYSDPPADVAPVLGRSVVFLSERVEHEVLPAQADRYAATAWYYGS